MKNHKHRPHLNLGVNVAKRRKALGIEAGDFAHKVGISLGSLRDLERGVSEGHITSRRSIAEILGCTLADLYAEFTPLHEPSPPPGRALQPPLKEGNVGLSEIAVLIDGFSRSGILIQLAVLFQVTGSAVYLDRLRALDKDFAALLPVRKMS